MILAHHVCVCAAQKVPSRYRACTRALSSFRDGLGGQRDSGHIGEAARGHKFVRSVHRLVQDAVRDRHTRHDDCRPQAVLALQEWCAARSSMPSASERELTRPAARELTRRRAPRASWSDGRSVKSIAPGRHARFGWYAFGRQRSVSPLGVTTRPRRSSACTVPSAPMRAIFPPPAVYARRPLRRTHAPGVHRHRGAIWRRHLDHR